MCMSKPRGRGVLTSKSSVRAFIVPVGDDGVVNSPKNYDLLFPYWNDAMKGVIRPQNELDELVQCKVLEKCRMFCGLIP